MEPLSFFSQFIIGPILCHSQAKPSQAHYSENAQYSRFLPMIYILWMCQSIHLMNVIISVMCSCSRPTNHHHHHSSSKTHYLCPAIEDIIYTWERERERRKTRRVRAHNQKMPFFCSTKCWWEENDMDALQRYALDAPFLLLLYIYSNGLLQMPTVMDGLGRTLHT